MTERQTGRTTRQLQLAVVEARTGKYVFFIVPHQRQVDFTMRMLMDLPLFAEGRTVVRPQRQIVEFKPGCVHVKAIEPFHFFMHGPDELIRGRKDVEVHYDHFFWEEYDRWLANRLQELRNAE